MIKCKICKRWFKTKKGCNIHRSLLHKNVQKQKEINTFDFNEIKTFITSEIQRMLKGFNFSNPINNNNIKDVGIVPIKITKIPSFNPFESNKRLVIKELKTELLKGISNVLQKIGSFDDQIDFLKVVEILV